MSSESDAGLDARLDRSVPSEQAAAFLMAGTGLQPGRIFPLSRNTTLVGRSERADVRIQQAAVSNEHARIMSGTQGFDIEDLDSVNGTYVNGMRITRSKLKRGDRLTFGNVEFTFLLAKTPDATVALLPPGARGGALVPVRPAIEARPAAHDRSRDVDDDEGMSLADMLRSAVRAYRVLRPHLPMAFSLMAIGIGVGFGSSFVVPPPNTAVCEAKLHQGKKTNPVDGEPRSPQDEDQLQFFLEPERFFVQPALVRSTLEKMEHRTPDEGRVAEISERLHMESAGDRLFRASYKEPTFGGIQPPALEFLEAHFDNYIKSDIDKGLRALDSQAKFLNEKLVTAQTEMSAINDELAKFKQANPDGLPETSQQARSSRYYYDTRKAELTAQITRLAGELAVDEAQVKDGNAMAQSKFQSSQTYRTSMADLKRKLSEAYARGLADGHPDVVQLKDEIARTEKNIEQEMSAETSAADRTADPAIVGLRNKVGIERAQLHAAQVEVQQIDQNLEKLKKAEITMPGVAAHLDDLQRRYDAKKRLQDQLADQAQKANLQLDIERVQAQSRYDIVTRPYLQRPSLPKTVGTRAGIGFGIGLILAIGLILLSEGRRFVARHLPSLES